jgi:hypothetical protein
VAMLLCTECGCESTGAERGWQGQLVDLNDDGGDEVAFFCPDCAAREFGGTPPPGERGYPEGGLPNTRR